MRLPTLQCIRETGFDRAPHVPLDPRITVQLYKSVDIVIPFFVYNTQGVPVDITANATITFVVKKRPSDHAAVASITGVAVITEGVGRGTFTIPAATFDFALEGKYFFEVIGVFGVAPSTLREPLIPLSPLQLLPSGSNSQC